MEKLNRRKTVEDLREPDKYFKSKERDSHPSYGMVSLSQISHNSGAQLFGSGIRHTNYMELKINHAERIRDPYGEHYFGKNRIITISLSPAQLSGLLTRTNTPGIPCTITFTEKDGVIETPPIHNVKVELIQDLKLKFQDVAKRVQELEKSIKSDLKGSPKKATKDKIKSEVGRLCNDISSNLLYLQQCQTEKMEQIGTEIIAEAESAMNSMINKAGLTHLQNQIKQIKE